YDDRFGKEYYLSQLTQADIDRVKSAESKISLATLISNWLDRMPYADSSKYWPHNGYSNFWINYREHYLQSLSDTEASNLVHFDNLFINEWSVDHAHRKFTQKSYRAALFIMLYRDYPLLHLPFQLITALMDIDDLLSTWRHR